MLNYDLNMPVRLITGRGCVAEQGAMLGRLGKRCAIITGKTSALRSGALADVQAALEKEGITWTLFDKVEPNPLLATCHAAGQQARNFGAEFVIGIGGGSPLDAAKAVAVFAANDIEMMDVFQNKWPNPVLPIVAVGTTAGTGSEVGPFSVMTQPNGFKRSFFGDATFPAIAFGDPGYTYSLPWKFTVSTGLDALCHAIEGYFNRRANDMSDLFALESSRMLWEALSWLDEHPGEQEVPHELRDQLYYASVLAGITLSRCGTCYCHTLGYFLTEQHGVPHGTACAAFVPDLLHRVQRLEPRRITRYLEGVGIELEALCGLIGRLTDYEPVSLTDAQLEEIVARQSGSRNFLSTYPQGFSAEDARALLKKMFQS